MRLRDCRWMPVLVSAAALGIAGGLLSAEEYHYPLKPAAADGGPLYVADLKFPGILAVKDGKVAAYYAAAKKIGTPLYRIRCLTVDRKGKLLAGDPGTREIYRFDEPGKPVPLLKGAAAGIGIPMSLAVDSKGNIFVADAEVGWIWKIPAGGSSAKRFAEIPAPRGMAIDSQDRLWIVSGSSAAALFRVLPNEKVETVVSGSPFQHPNDVALGPDGTAYVSDNYAKTIWKIGPDGKPQSWISGSPLVNPGGLAWYAGALIIADPNPKTNTGQVYRADATGKLSPLVAK